MIFSTIGLILDLITADRLLYVLVFEPCIWGTFIRLGNRDNLSFSQGKIFRNHRTHENSEMRSILYTQYIRYIHTVSYISNARQCTTSKIFMFHTFSSLHHRRVFTKDASDCWLFFSLQLFIVFNSSNMCPISSNNSFFLERIWKGNHPDNLFSGVDDQMLLIPNTCVWFF